MRLKHFFTKQRYLILGIGLVSFVVCILLAHHFSHDSETGVLFIDLAGSAVTIIATALAIEYLQFREKADKTRQVAAIAEEEIQVIGYRTKLAVVRLYGFNDDSSERRRLDSLDAIGSYLKQNMQSVDTFYKGHDFKPVSGDGLTAFSQACGGLQLEVEKVIGLFDYALPESLRATILALRSCLQISERAIGFMPDSNTVNSSHQHLLAELTSSVFSSADTVLDHESRTSKNQPIARKPGRLGRHQ